MKKFPMKEKSPNKLLPLDRGRRFFGKFFGCSKIDNSVLNNSITNYRVIDFGHMKKEISLILIVFITIFLVNIISAASLPEPVVVQGYVYEKVFGNLIDLNNANIQITVTGDSQTKVANTSYNDPVHHGLGHYDAVLSMIKGDTITVSLSFNGTTCSGTNSTAFTDSNQIININLCCYPTSASSLVPQSFHANGSAKEVTFSWTSGTKGNSSYSQIWENFSSSPSTGSVNNAVSPVTKNVTTLSSWTIQTCNGNMGGGYCCRTATASTPNVNHNCSQPSDLAGSFTNSQVIMTWNSSSTDIDGDACHDEIIAKSYASGDAFESPSANYSNTSANKSGESITAYKSTYWQVRSCDNLGSCSSYSTLLTPSCTQTCPVCASSAGFGASSLSRNFQLQGNAINVTNILNNGLKVFGALGYLSQLNFSSSNFGIMADLPQPVVVQGYVREKVFGNLIDLNNANIQITVTGDSQTVVANTSYNDPLGHALGHYDAILSMVRGNTITVSASYSGTTCSGTNSTPFSDNNQIININLCCYPTSASSLVPQSFHANGSAKDVTFSWTSGTKGNSSYNELWENFSSSPSTGSVNDAVSPITKSVTTLSSWTIQTCNGNMGGGYCCTSTTASTPNVNHNCSQPSDLAGSVSGGQVVMTWSSNNSDIDGDACHDEIIAKSYASGDAFESPSANYSSTSANKAGEGITSYEVSYWQVRSCDNLGRVDSCSSYSTLITSSCSSGSCPPCNPPGGGGGGGGGGRTYDFIINESLIKVNIGQGALIKKSISIKNPESISQTITIKFSDSLKGLVSINEQNITLKPNEIKVFDVYFQTDIDTNPDVYTGGIMLKSPYKDKEVSIVSNVYSKESLFDVRLIIPKKYKIRVPKQNLLMDINLFNLASVDKTDVILDLFIKDSKGNIVINRTENVSVYGNTSISRFFKLPGNIRDGNYFAGAKVIYEDSVAVSSDSFKVGRIRWWILIVTLIIVAFIIWNAVYYKKHNKFMFQDYFVNLTSSLG